MVWSPTFTANQYNVFRWGLFVSYGMHAILSQYRTIREHIQSSKEMGDDVSIRDCMRQFGHEIE